MEGMEPSDSGRRTETRAKFRLKVRFKNADSFINEYTHNISKGGLFIRTSKPCGLREKVGIVLILPESEQEVGATGEVIHIVAPEQADEQTPSGMGVQILEWQVGAQDQIERFIKDKLKIDADIKGRRRYERVEAKLRIKFESKEALVEEYIHNLSHGGLFIATTKPRSTGEHLSVILIHPENSQEMLLHGEVVRVVTAADSEKQGLNPGMGIKFLKLDQYVRNEIDKFIKNETNKAAGKDLIVEES